MFGWWKGCVNHNMLRQMRTFLKCDTSFFAKNFSRFILKISQPLDELAQGLHRNQWFQGYFLMTLEVLWLLTAPAIRLKYFFCEISHVFIHLPVDIYVFLSMTCNNVCSLGRICLIFWFMQKHNWKTNDNHISLSGTVHWVLCFFCC